MTAEAVAKLASKAFGIPMSSLSVKKPTKKPQESKYAQESTYAFVYWHVARRVWYAQAKPAHGGATLDASSPKPRQLGH